MLRRFFADKAGQIVIFEWPNVPLAIWLTASLAHKFVDGSAGSMLSVVSVVSILIWAVLEIALGHSLFRRVLGVVVCCHIVWDIYQVILVI